MENIKCPNCKKSYFSERYCTRTAVYYPPVYKDGINVNPDGNITTHCCYCLNCGNEFSYSTQYGKLYKEE